MDASSSPLDYAAASDKNRRWRWWWFAGGFVIAFMGLLLFYPMIVMHPSGQYVFRARLWTFYAYGLPEVFGPSTMGPASNNSDALGIVAAEHLAFSALAGCIAAGIGWWLRRRNA
jgi:hypothetical protein